MTTATQAEVKQYREREEAVSQKHYQKLHQAAAARGETFIGAKVSELYKGQRPKDGDCWGPWQFQASNLTLQLKGKFAHFHREIDLEQLRSAAEIMNWLGHFMEKNWGTAEVMGHLICALYDLSFHTWWGDPHVNLTKSIQERYKEAR
jgi:hypothetical protein